MLSIYYKFNIYHRREYTEDDWIRAHDRDAASPTHGPKGLFYLGGRPLWCTNITE